MQARLLLVPAALLLGACLDQPTAPDRPSQADGGPATAALAIAIGSQPTDLGTLGGTFSGAGDINARGQIVGTSETKFGERRGFLWTSGVMTELKPLGGSESGASAINDAGQIAGYSTISGDWPVHAVIWQNGIPRDLGTRASDDHESGAEDINAVGQVVGYSNLEEADDGYSAIRWTGGVPQVMGFGPGQAYALNAVGHVVGEARRFEVFYRHAFLQIGDRAIDLATLGSTVSQSAATGINSYDQVIGGSQSSAGYRAVLWENGRMRNLGTLPGQDHSEARGINDNGQIVGVSGNSAFVWYNGVMYSLRNLGAGNSSAIAVNSAGDVVGSSNSHAVRWTLPPVNFWTARKAMPSARRDAAVAVLNGVVHVLGGVNQAGTALKTVAQYDAGTNAWSTGVPLPAARHSGNGARVIGSWLYLPGGFDAEGNLTRTLFAYNLTTRVWSSRAKLPLLSGCGGSAVIDGKLYVFTGCTGPRGETRVGLLHRYDPATNAWSALSPAPAAHRQPAVASLEGKLYVAGGVDAAGNVSARLDVYTPAGNSWSTKAGMPTARRGGAGVALGGRFHVIGGMANASTLKTVEAYDPVTDFWVPRAPILTARSGFGVGLVDGFAYAVGGRDGSTTVAATERYTP